MANWEKLIEEHYSKKNKIDENTIFELIEQALLAEGYQDSEVIKNHPSMRLSTKGTKKAGGEPYDEDPPKARSKSAPAGFGALEEVSGIAHDETMGRVVTDASGNKLTLTAFKSYAKTDIKDLFAGDSGKSPLKKLLTINIEDYLKTLSGGKPYTIAYTSNKGITAEQEKKLQSAVVVVGKEDDGTVHAFIRFGGGTTWAKGKFAKATGYSLGLSNPNRGELSEAFIAAAIVLRFLNLPDTADFDANGVEIRPAKGLVTTAQVTDFLIDGLKSGEITAVGDSDDDVGEKGEAPDESTSGIKFSKKISPGKVEDKTPVDTIRMKVELRKPSMQGLLKIADPKSFVRTDSLVQKYLEAATNYANKEIIKWAVGVSKKATNELDPSKAMGFFINKFDNVITVSGIGTKTQSLTKVDLQMTCSGEGCPATGVSIDGAGDLNAPVKQLARLSLKAGPIKHFGGGAATSPQKAVDVLQGVFPVGDKDKEFKKKLEAWKNNQRDELWGFKTVTSKNKKGETKTKKVFDKGASNVDKIAAHRASELRKLITTYFNYVKTKLTANKDGSSDPEFLEKMVKGLLSHSVEGKVEKKKDGTIGKDYSNETGVILVQSTDAGDFYKIDFTKLKAALGTGADFSATQVGDDNPYLTIWTSRIENEEGDVVDIKPPESVDDPRVLFTMRLLARHPTKGGEILRLEKGPLMKKVAGLDQEKDRLVYRDGKLVAV